MGTPEFAVASLDALRTAGCHIVAVVTAPDKPAGRGMQLQQSAVKKYAVEHGLTVLQPEKLRDPAFLDALRALQADLQIIVAFRMLPEIVWNMPPMGSVNLHGSLLPQYRGAAPINWAVINGETATGVTTFKLKHAIDTGDILLQKSFPIMAEETAGDVHDKMKTIGAALLVETVKGLAAGTLREQPQPTGEAGELKHAPKIFTETCQVNWNQPVDTIHNLIRGLSPFPAAFTSFEGKTLKLLRSSIEKSTPGIAPGAFLTDQKTFLKFAGTDGFIHITELQLEGKKKMAITDFLRGYRFK
ncbi:MAG: methionyl-tRNA formyltransferase [Bacteroidota bacterium]|nr:methionyl-tRNA formyltransferase [Bacteroidota bacterium]